MTNVMTNEMMNKEELEQVAGSGCDQTAMDSRFLNVLLRGREGQCNRYGSFKVFFGFGILEEIEKAWKSVGIDAKLDYSGYPNEYYLNVKQITCDQAYDHAQQVVGKTLRRYDYNY